MKVTARAGSLRLATSSSWTEVGGAAWAGLTQRRVSWRRGQGEAVLVGRGGAGGQSHLALVADTDYVTALCSQVVYEGLVDDTFRIKCGRSAGSCSGRASGFVPGIVLGSPLLQPRPPHGDSPGAGCC